MRAFNFKRFTNKIHRAFDETFSLEEVRKLLELDGGYDKDSSFSTGKRLLLQRIYFIGEKNGQPFQYDRELKTGVNTWIGDNQKGKSSIFKIIKLTLTGSHKHIGKDVLKWINKIYLQYKIGERIFTNVVELYHTKLDSGKLYFKTIDELLNDDIAKSSFEWEVSAWSRYEAIMEKLFFDEFNYYSMQWTQKTSSRSNINLSKSNASWKTYFYSIYLESKDYGTLVYGQQESLIIQMLFGLSLTYPINRLGVRYKLKENDLGIKKATPKGRTKNSVQKEIDITNKNLKLIKDRLEYLDKKSFNTNAHKKLEEINLLMTQKNKIRESRRNIVFKRHSVENKKIKNDELLHYFLERFDNTKKLRLKKQRELQQLIEYKGLDVLFSNIDVHSCPNCNYEITTEDKVREKEDYACSLCHTPLSQEEVSTEIKELDLKIESIKGKIEETSKELELIKNKGDKERILNNNFIQEINFLKQQEDKFDTNDIDNKIDQLDLQINKYEYTFSKHNEELKILYRKEGGLNEQLKYLNKELSKSTSEEAVPDKLSEEIKLIKFAIEELKSEREKQSEKILRLFKETFLDLLHDFGLTNYISIDVDQSFKIFFNKNNTRVSFSDTSEGEQLRIKLAFYLSIIQLDVKDNYGRHVRFIILDTPGKEEADSSYIDGLKETIININQQYGNDLQLFIGTQLRAFVDVTDAHKQEIKQPNETFF